MSDPSPPPFDIVFDEVEGVQLEATVFPAHKTSKKSSSTLLFYHSGGLTGGSRLGFFPYWLSNLASTEGFHLVTFDYRLFPTAAILELEKDLIKGYAYTVNSLSAELESRGFSGVESGRIVICGASAGVYCASILTLHLVEAGTPPSAFLGLYGETNIGGSFYNVEKAADDVLGISARQPMSLLQHLFDSGRKPLVGTEVKWFITAVKDVSQEDRELYDQATLCNNLFYSGTCADAFTGVEGVSKALGAVSGITEDLSKQRAIIPESSIHLFPLLRITPSFPPTLLFHGERDVAIPISDSEVFDSELKRNGVPSRFIRVEGEGSGHGFDRQDFGHWYEKDLRDNTLWLFSQV